MNVFDGDEQELAEQHRERAQRVQALETADLQEVLSSPAGRRVLRRVVFARCGVLRHTYDADARRDALKQGERNIGLWLLAQCAAVDPSAPVRLLGEPEREKPV